MLDVDSASWHTVVLLLAFQLLCSFMALSNIWSSFPFDAGGLGM